MSGGTDGATVSDGRVQAAAERWARAAGVPLSTAHGWVPQRGPVTLRFLRGVLLGAALGVFLLLVSRADGAPAALWVLLAVAVGLLAVRIAASRRHRVPGATGPSQG